MSVSLIKERENKVTISLKKRTNREIVDKGKINGGTNYAPVMKAVVKDYLRVGLCERIKRFFGTITIVKRPPMFNIFITDGSNSDTYETERVIVSASSHGLFWQCVGVDSTSFPFLEKLDTLRGRFADNANFFQVNDISNISDEELYDRLLKEFPTWLDVAYREGIL